MTHICLKLCLFGFVGFPSVTGVKLTARRSIVLPQVSIPDGQSVAPYPDSQLATYFPTPVPISVAGIDHPYFKPGQNLPQVDLDALTSSSASR